MSCNGCRVLRKGCSESCILRHCLQWIEDSDAQGHATVFLAKFFGRAGLMGFINAVPDSQRPALFQSLLYEACGRTVNPVFGAVGLLASGNWQLCQAAVETVLKGGSLRPGCPSTLLPSFMPVPRVLITTKLEQPVAANEALNSGRIQQVVPSRPFPELFSSELYKPRSLGMGCFSDKNVQQAWGHAEERKNVHSHGVVRGDLNGISTRSAQELQQHRMMQGSALHLSTWPGAVSVSFYPSKHQASNLDVKDEQAVGMEERHEALGLRRMQVLAPVARRVKPRLSAAAADSVIANPLSKSGSQVLASGLGSNRIERQQPELLELDLTLKVQDTKAGSPATTTGLQFSSPSSCESVISEGSITSHHSSSSSQVVPSSQYSLSTTPSWAVECCPCPFPAVAPPPEHHHHHKLLPLLL